MLFFPPFHFSDTFLELSFWKLQSIVLKQVDYGKMIKIQLPVICDLIDGETFWF